jgi:hypothetical protein
MQVSPATANPVAVVKVRSKTIMVVKTEVMGMVGNEWIRWGSPSIRTTRRRPGKDEDNVRHRGNTLSRCAASAEGMVYLLQGMLIETPYSVALY